MNTDVMFSSKTDLWATSKEMFTTDRTKNKAKTFERVAMVMAE